MTSWSLWVAHIAAGGAGGLIIGWVGGKVLTAIAHRRARQRVPPLLPDPPHNVRIVKADGTVVPVECQFRGWDEQGDAVWQSVRLMNFAPWRGDTVRVDILPARTTIQIAAVSD